MKARCAILLLLILSWTGFLSARESLKPDSVLQIVNRMPDKERLTYLVQKLKENALSPIRLTYARLLYNEANRQANDEYKADAIYMLALHFYSLNIDSLKFYVDKAEPLYLTLNRLEDICRMKAWYIYALNIMDRKEESLLAVSALKQFGDRIGFPEAYEMADQAMADFYFRNNLPEDGERLYLDVVDKMKNRAAPLIKQFNIYRQLSIKAKDSENRLHYLSLAEKILDEAKEKDIAYLDSENPVHVLEYVIARTYAHEYLMTEEYDKVREPLQKADSLASKYDMARAETELNELYYQYYIGKNDLKKGLEYVDKYISAIESKGVVSKYLESLQRKASLLSEMGRYDEAYFLSEQLLYMKDSISQNDFHQTLANVRTEYEVERLEMENQHMEEKARQIRQKAVVLLTGCIILFLVILGLIYMIRIIQRHRKELKIAKEKAEEADRLKSTFLANMNHEIRTPLNAIVGFSQIMAEEEDKNTRLEFSNIIQNNNELLQRLIGDVLDISKLESNSMSLIYAEQDLPVIMKEIYEMISMRMEGISDAVKLILDNCQPCRMETDRNRLIQILTNLLTNAIKHTTKGTIRFGYTLVTEGIRFYVKDTGEGIPEEDLKNIFNRFVQLENGKKGVGLGLAISKGLVTKMGGTISVESQVGEGSTFYVEVPFKKP